MVHIIPDSVFESNCEIIVNTVNCHGVMGAGIALECSLRFPEMFEQYKKDCLAGKIRTGEIKIYECCEQKILNFPTKGDEEREKSKIEYIESGLMYFLQHYKEYGAKSIAFPPLGCSNGKLDFENEVKSVMLKYLSIVDDVDIYICMNSMGAQGLELRMTKYIKDVDIDDVIKNLSLDIDAEQLKLSIKQIDRFSQLASSKYLKNEEMYRKIWNYIHEKVVIK